MENYREDTDIEMFAKRIMDEIQGKIECTETQLEITKSYENQKSDCAYSDIAFFTDRKQCYEDILETVSKILKEEREKEESEHRMIFKDDVLKIINPRLNSSKFGSLEYQKINSIIMQINQL